MTMLPLSASTASEKLSTILLSTAIAVALSAGDELLRAGLTVSALVKLRDVVSEMPA